MHFLPLPIFCGIYLVCAVLIFLPYFTDLLFSSTDSRSDIVESTQLWGGFIFFNLSQRDAVFDAYLKFADNMDSDLSSQLIVSVQYDGTQRILLAVMSNIDAVDMAPAFDNFRSIENTSSTLSIGNIAELVPQFTGPTPLGL